MVEGLRWGGSGSSPAHGNALPGGSANQSAAQMTGGRSAAGSATAGSSGGSSPGGAPSGTAVAPIEVVTSWAAYPYAAAFVAQLSHHWMGAPARQIDVSVRDSDAWPGEMCNGGAKAPDIEYAFEQAESGRPCPRDDSGHPSPVVAVPIGYEILVLARSPLYGEVDFTPRQLFLALAKWVPDPSHAGTVHENPSTTWRQIDSTLGQEPIAFVGPPLSSAAGRSMIELLMEDGCNTYPWIAALEWTNPDQYARICRTVRSDGVYVEVSGLAAGTLLVQPNAVGILTSFGALVPHSHGRLPLDGLAVSKLDGVLPTEQNVLSGDYPGSRRLYLFTRGRVAPNVLTLLEAVQMPYMRYQDSALVPPSRQDLREVYDDLP
jgi:phosphate transport system substrate-binding protein